MQWIVNYYTLRNLDQSKIISSQFLTFPHILFSFAIRGQNRNWYVIIMKIIVWNQKSINIICDLIQIDIYESLFRKCFYLFFVFFPTFFATFLGDFQTYEFQSFYRFIQLFIVFPTLFGFPNFFRFLNFFRFPIFFWLSYFFFGFHNFFQEKS